jgi:hypothetical protein
MGVSMQTKAHVNITLDSTILDWIDRLRGQSPRSSFINSILSRFCQKEQAIFDWESESRKADEDIKKGRVHKFRDTKKAVKWLKS